MKLASKAHQQGLCFCDNLPLSAHALKPHAPGHLDPLMPHAVPASTLCLLLRGLLRFLALEEKTFKPSLVPGLPKSLLPDVLFFKSTFYDDKARRPACENPQVDN